MAEKSAAANQPSDKANENSGTKTTDTVSAAPFGGDKAEKGAPVIEDSVTAGDVSSLFPDKAQEKKPEASPRFIKADDSSFVSVKAAQNGDAAFTSVEKYTDRLSPATPQKKEHTGYTGKINTYSANHSAAENAPKFISVSEKELSEAAAKPGSAKPKPRAQTKIIPQLIEDEALSDGDAGVIVEKLPEGAAAGDEPTKHISAGKGSLLRELAKTSDEDIRQNPDQLMLDGFSELENNGADAAKNADSELLEDELVRVRKKRINDFRFWDKEKDEAGEVEDSTFTVARDNRALPRRLKKFADKFSRCNSSFVPVGDEEYTDFGNRRRVFSSLIELRTKTLIRAIAVSVLGLLLFIINIAASVSAAANNGFFDIFAGNNTVYAAVNLVLLLAALVLTAGDLKRGLFSLLKLRPKTDTAYAFMMLSCFAENAALFFTQQKTEADFHMLTGAAVILCVPLLLSRVFYYDSIRHCFKAVAVKSDKSYLREISNEKLVSSVLSDGNTEKRNVVYTGKTRFISSFLKRSADCAFGGQISSRVVLINIFLSVLTGVLTAARWGNIMLGLSAMTFSAALSFPVGCLLFTGFMLASENKLLCVKSSFIQSYSDARDFAEIDNIVLNADEIFSMEITETAAAAGVNKKQAHFCAAALTDKAGGLLKTAFQDTAREFEGRLPEAEDLTYEDRLGFSAWINGCRVLLGSNAFLVNHNVKMPDEKSIMGFIEEGNLPLYLAIEGHFAAMFSVKYSCGGDALKKLRAIVDNGTNLLLMSDDPNITDAFAEKLLALPADSVRVINKNAAEKICEQKKTVTDSEDAGVVFADSFEAFSRTAFSALKLSKTKKLAKIICETASCTGAALALILAFTGSVSAISCWLPVIIQLLWVGLIFVLPVFFSGSSSIPLSASTVRPMARREAYTPQSDTSEAPAEEPDSIEAVPENSAVKETAKETAAEQDDGLFNQDFLSEEEKRALEKQTAESYSFTLKAPADAQSGEYGNGDDEDEAPTYTKSPRTQAAAYERRRPAAKKSSGFFGTLAAKLSSAIQNMKAGDEDEYSDSIPKAAQDEQTAEKPSILSFAKEDPAPPKYKLEKPDDFMTAKFTPPDTAQPENLYNDAFFKRFEDDNIFAGLDSQREDKPLF